MQAYLNTKTGQYFESITGQPRSLDWIEIPLDAQAYITTVDFNGFIKSDLCGAIMLYENNKWGYGTGSYKVKLRNALWICSSGLLKEYLIKQNAGGFMYKEAYDKGFTPKCWIEIPAGATFATGKTKPIFRKDGFYWDDEDPIGRDGVPFWRETSVTLSNAEACGLEVVWVREEPSMNEIIKTAEEYRQSQSEPPALTDFGTGILSVSSETVYHFYACPHNPSWPPVDGIIVFDGRISGAEDYDRLCVMIAEHINRKPDDFAIRSLTIVG